jgi:hypothetical protein
LQSIAPGVWQRINEERVKPCKLKRPRFYHI